MERGRKGAVTYRILVICWSIHTCYRETKKGMGVLHKNFCSFNFNGSRYQSACTHCIMTHIVTCKGSLQFMILMRLTCEIF